MYQIFALAEIMIGVIVGIIIGVMLSPYIIS